MIDKKKNIYIVLIFLIIAYPSFYLITNVKLVKSNSMQPLLNDNYLVLISKKVKNIKKDMIYGFTVDNKIVIKRAIAVNENIVEIKNGILYINNQEDKRNYKIVFSNDNFGPEKIKNDEVFFLGDNRLQSIDSRSYGAININKIEFRVIMIIFPMKKLSVIL